MSLIFISHSSRDNAKAMEIKAWLEHPDRGYQSVFLDFDPADGIPAGRDWEKELYARLRSSQAVIALCSEHSMASEWCFAEITQARALGKVCIAVKIGSCTPKPILTRDQVVDLTANEAEGYERLRNGLLEAGLDPRNIFNLDATRPPYPGLMAFQEQDAALYHGRDTDIREVIELLNRMTRQQIAGVAVILGASGSGKSSLLRAGVLPRLKKTGAWIVVGPVQPRSRPIDQLARAIEDAFDEAGERRPWREVRDLLLAVDREVDAAPFIDLAYDLQRARKSRGAAVLIAVDQAEELWAQASGTAADEFLRVLKLVLEAPDTPLVALATLRSDYLEPFQSSFARQRIRFEPGTLAPMPVENLPQIIERPAALAGLMFEPGLVHAMVLDTKHSDALSLLAFSLRELWELRGRDGRLTLDIYRNQLGGLQRALERAAEQVIASCDLTEDTERLLRRVFVSLARIDEGGRFVRNPVPWTAVPEEARESLRRFVAARLLVSGEMQGTPIVEVAHEDLFHAWERLDRWLKDDQLFLLGRKRLSAALADWQRLRQDDAVLLRGGVLSEAESWLAERRSDLSAAEQAFIEASIASREAERAEERRQLEEERTLRERAEEQQRYAESREFAARALLVMVDDPAEALTHAIASSRRAPTREAEVVLRRAIGASHAHAILRHDGAVLDAAFSPDGTLVATAGADGTAAVWHAESGRLRHRLTAHASDRFYREVFRVAFSPDGRTLATAGRGGVVRLWDVETGAERHALKGHSGSVVDIAFNREGTQLVSSSADATVRLWDVERGEECHVFSGHMGTPWQTAFSPDGRFVIAGADDSYTFFIWDIATREHVTSESTGSRVVCNSFSPDGKRIVTASLERGATIWNADSITSMRDATPLSGHVGRVRYAAFDSNTKVITCGEDGTARIWGCESGPPERWREIAVVRGHDKAVVHATLSADKVVTAGADGTARVWEQTPPGIMQAESWHPLVELHGHKGPVVRARLSPGGLFALTASEDGTARLWSTEPGHEAGLVRQRGATQIEHVAFSADGRRVAVSTSGFLFVQTQIIEADTQRPITSLTPAQEGLLNLPPTPRGMRFSPDRRRLVTSYYVRETAHVWDAETGHLLAELVGHAKYIESARFSTDGAWVMTASKDKAIGLWEAESGRQVGLFDASGVDGRQAMLSPEKDRVLAWSPDRVFHVWEGAEWAHRTLSLEGLDPQGVTCTAISADANTVAAGSIDGAVRLWDARSGAERRRLPGNGAEVRQVRFSGDSQKVVTLAADGVVHLWDDSSDNHVDITAERPTDVKLSDDGVAVLTIQADGSLRVWDGRSGGLLAVLAAEPSRHSFADISSDGRRVMTLREDKTARVFLVHQGELLELAVSRVPVLAHVGDVLAEEALT